MRYEFSGLKVLISAKKSVRLPALWLFENNELVSDGNLCNLITTLIYIPFLDLNTLNKYIVMNVL